jgi:type III secretion protein Q
MTQLRHAGFPAESIGQSANAAMPGHSHPHRVAIRLGSFEIDLLPDESAAPLAHALEAALAERTPLSTQRLLQWPLRTCIALGTRRMARARFAALHPGDAVFGGLMDHVHLRIVSARSRTWVAQVHIDKQDTIMITDPFGEEVARDFEAIPDRPQRMYAEGESATPATAETEDVGLRALARLPLEIRYEIDGPDLSVSEAAELTPGDVLVLPVPVDGAVVRLRCQGRTIARGELLNVGGQLGVRITEAGECA